MCDTTVSFPFLTTLRIQTLYNIKKQTFYGAAGTGPGLPHNLEFTTHSDTPHSVGLLWTSDQPDAETSFYLIIHNNHERERERRPYGRPDSNPQPQQANGRRPNIVLQKLLFTKNENPSSAILVRRIKDFEVR